jgi:uncharacterized protein with GYD domain
MPHYLFLSSYTREGLEGLLADGGTGRRKAIEQLATSLGGHLESLFFAFGDTDVFGIVDLPDDEAAAAAAMKVNASGAATVRTTKLLTPEQVDEAVGRQLSYSAPGAG